MLKKKNALVMLSMSFMLSSSMDGMATVINNDDDTGIGFCRGILTGTRTSLYSNPNISTHEKLKAHQENTSSKAASYDFFRRHIEKAASIRYDDDIAAIASKLAGFLDRKKRNLESFSNALMEQGAGLESEVSVPFNQMETGRRTRVFGAYSKYLYQAEYGSALSYAGKKSDMYNQFYVFAENLGIRNIAKDPLIMGILSDVVHKIIEKCHLQSQLKLISVQEELQDKKNEKIKRIDLYLKNSGHTGTTTSPDYIKLKNDALNSELKVDYDEMKEGYFQISELGQLVHEMTGLGSWLEEKIGKWKKRAQDHASDDPVFSMTAHLAAINHKLLASSSAQGDQKNASLYASDTQGKHQSFGIQPSAQLIPKSNINPYGIQHALSANREGEKAQIAGASMSDNSNKPNAEENLRPNEIVPVAQNHNQEQVLPAANEVEVQKVKIEPAVPAEEVNQNPVQAGSPQVSVVPAEKAPEVIQEAVHVIEPQKVVAEEPKVEPVSPVRNQDENIQNQPVPVQEEKAVVDNVNQ